MNWRRFSIGAGVVVGIVAAYFLLNHFASHRVAFLVTTALVILTLAALAIRSVTAITWTGWLIGNTLRIPVTKTLAVLALIAIAAFAGFGGVEFVMSNVFSTQEKQEHDRKVAAMLTGIVAPGDSAAHAAVGEQLQKARQQEPNPFVQQVVGALQQENAQKTHPAAVSEQKDKVFLGVQLGAGEAFVVAGKGDAPLRAAPDTTNLGNR